MNPPSEDWTPIRLRADKFRFGSADYHVRNLETLSDGSITAEVALPDDPHWRAYLDRLFGIVDG